MRRILFFFIILLVIPLIGAFEVDYNNYTTLDIEFLFDTSLYLEYLQSNPSVENLQVMINTFPRQNQLQKIISLDIITTPKATSSQENDLININWDNPTAKEFNIKIKSFVKAENAIAKVDKPIKFPLTLTSEKEYTFPTEHIEITTLIRHKAQEISSGKSELYEVAFELANWVHKNIIYNSTEITANSTMPSSWVLKNKIGVCDEITNLFASFARSLDISTKFITGLAYSNQNGKWSPHAWAEVYFPGYGWVPFDTTYGQYGWIDPTHIKLGESADSGTPSTTYKWKAYGTQLVLGESILQATLKDKQGTVPKIIGLTINPLIKKAGPGSYIPIEVTVKNGQDIYLPEEISLIKSPEIGGKSNEALLLKPNEIKKFYWFLRAPVALETGYMYTSEIKVEDMFHISATENLTFANNYKIYTEEEAKQLVEDASKQKIQLTSSFELNCESDDYVYVYENALITCNVTNKLNKTLENVRVCAAGACKDLVIENQNQINITVIPEKSGLRSYVVQAAYQGEILEETETFTILDSPDLRIIDLEVPLQVSYAEDANISFVTVVQAPVKDVKIVMNGNLVMEFDTLDASKQAIVHFSGKNIYSDDKISLEIKYKDENGKEYIAKKETIVEVINVPWYVPILKFFGLM